MAILDLRLDPSKNELRWFGLILLLFFSVVAGVVYLQSGSTIAPRVIVGVGLTLSVMFYALRPLRLPIYRLWMRAFHPIGWLVSHAILVSIYYLILTPIGLLLRVVGYDPLHRKFDAEPDTYWTHHDPAGRPERYFHQF